jgi:hypothetical protein
LTHFLNFSNCSAPLSETLILVPFKFCTKTK